MENVIDRVRLKTLAKDQIRGNIGRLFLCTIIMSVIGGVCGMIPVVGIIGNILVSGPLEFGLCLIFLGLTQGEDVVVGTLFRGFDEFEKCILVYFFRGLFTFLWTLLLIVPGIIKGLAYSMSMYVAIDNPQLSSLEVLRESERIMYGHKMDLFILELSFLPWFLLMIPTLGLASIYVIPYMQATTTNFYNQIKYEA